MSMERTTLLLRPSLRFIATLPTLKIKETIMPEGKIVIWKVEPDEPVNISGMVLNTFFIGAVKLERFSQEKGWQYDMKIGIKSDLGHLDFLIDLREEDWYLKNKWWDWLVGVNK